MKKTILLYVIFIAISACVGGDTDSMKRIHHSKKDVNGLLGIIRIYIL